MKREISKWLFSRIFTQMHKIAEVQTFFPPYGIPAVSKELTPFDLPTAATSCGPPGRTFPSGQHRVVGAFGRHAPRAARVLRAPGPSGEIARTCTALLCLLEAATSRRPQQVAALPHAAPRITSRRPLLLYRYPTSPPHGPRSRIVREAEGRREGVGRFRAHAAGM